MVFLARKFNFRATSCCKDDVVKAGAKITLTFLFVTLTTSKFVPLTSFKIAFTCASFVNFILSLPFP